MLAPVRTRPLTSTPAPLLARDPGMSTRLLTGTLALLLLACGPAPAQPAATAATDVSATLTRLAAEPEGDGRRPLYAEIRRAPAEQALPALRAGLSDTNPALRAAAALASGRRKDGDTLGPELIELARADPEMSVRLAATRGLGNLRHAAAYAPLQHNLSDESAPIRLAALRALARIDPDRTAALPDLAGLQLDHDRRVADVATKIARGIALH
jgi:HEAT repeat protein